MDALTDLISIADAARLVPSPRGRTHPDTIRRWMKAGRLPTVRRGGSVFTLRSALVRMFSVEAPQIQTVASRREEEGFRKWGLMP